MSAVLAIKKSQGPEKCLEQLNSCIEIHFKSLKVGFKTYLLSYSCFAAFAFHLFLMVHRASHFQ